MKTTLYPDPKFLCRSFAAGMIMMLCVISAEAQSWALPSSRWHFTVANCSFSPSFQCFEDLKYSLRVEKDTTLYGHVCSKVIHDPGGYLPATREFFTYQFADTVYFYLDGAYRPVMYLSARQGDTLQFYKTSSWTSSQYVLGRVEYVTAIIAYGDTFRKYRISSVDPTNRWWVAYAERLGFLNTQYNDFYPAFEVLLDADEVNLCNYGDSTLGNYWLYPDSVCHPDPFITGIQELQPGDALRCYPNPSSGTFTIDMSSYGSEIKTVHIFDAVGRLVYSQESQMNQITIDPHLLIGVYTVEAMADHRYYRTKIIIQ